MEDEIRTSVDLIAVTQAASAIASADAKRAAGNDVLRILIQK